MMASTSGLGWAFGPRSAESTRSCLANQEELDVVHRHPARGKHHPQPVREPDQSGDAAAELEPLMRMRRRVNGASSADLRGRHRRRPALWRCVPPNWASTTCRSSTDCRNEVHNRRYRCISIPRDGSRPSSDPLLNRTSVVRGRHPLGARQGRPPGSPGSGHIAAGNPQLAVRSPRWPTFGRRPSRRRPASRRTFRSISPGRP